MKIIADFFKLNITQLFNLYAQKGSLKQLVLKCVETIQSDLDKFVSLRDCLYACSEQTDEFIIDEIFSTITFYHQAELQGYINYKNEQKQKKPKPIISSPSVFLMDLDKGQPIKFDNHEGITPESLRYNTKYEMVHYQEMFDIIGPFRSDTYAEFQKFIEPLNAEAKGFVSLLNKIGSLGESLDKLLATMHPKINIPKMKDFHQTWCHELKKYNEAKALLDKIDTFELKKEMSCSKKLEFWHDLRKVFSLLYKLKNAAQTLKDRVTLKEAFFRQQEAEEVLKAKSNLMLLNKEGLLNSSSSSQENEASVDMAAAEVVEPVTAKPAAAEIGNGPLTEMNLGSNAKITLNIDSNSKTSSDSTSGLVSTGVVSNSKTGSELVSSGPKSKTSSELKSQIKTDSERGPNSKTSSELEGSSKAKSGLEQGPLPLNEAEKKQLQALYHNLTDNQITTFKNLFRKKTSDQNNEITLAGYKSLIEGTKIRGTGTVVGGLGGKIITRGGSHYRCQIPNTYRTWTISKKDNLLGYLDIPQATDGNFVPHGFSHSESNLPSISRAFCIRLFERAGFTPARLALAGIELNVEHPKKNK